MPNKVEHNIAAIFNLQFRIIPILKDSRWRKKKVVLCKRKIYCMINNPVSTPNFIYSMVTLYSRNNSALSCRLWCLHFIQYHYAVRMEYYSNWIYYNVEICRKKNSHHSYSSLKLASPWFTSSWAFGRNALCLTIYIPVQFERT